MVTLGGLDVELVELGRSSTVPRVHDDPGLGGLLDVAPPQLVHSGEQLLGRPSGERQLEDEPRLAGGETLLLLRRSPAELAESVAGPGGLVVDLVGHGLAEPGDPLVGDRRLDRFGAPAPGDRSGADPYAEGAGRAQVISQRASAIPRCRGQSSR